MKVARKWIDPFEKMSDEEFDTHVAELFAARPATVAVSLRMAPGLLSRLKRQAASSGVRYQTFMKGILEAGVSRLERTDSRSSRRAKQRKRRTRKAS
jgi:predicted DNA binding CopG/RHH family protein